MKHIKELKLYNPFPFHPTPLNPKRNMPLHKEINTMNRQIYKFEILNSSII